MSCHIPSLTSHAHITFWWLPCAPLLWLSTLHSLGFAVGPLASWLLGWALAPFPILELPICKEFLKLDVFRSLSNVTEKQQGVWKLLQLGGLRACLHKTCFCTKVGKKMKIKLLTYIVWFVLIQDNKGTILHFIPEGLVKKNHLLRLIVFHRGFVGCLSDYTRHNTMANQAFCPLMLLCGTYQLSVWCNTVYTRKSDKVVLTRKS